jgi:hypothetical protein
MANYSRNFYVFLCSIALVMGFIPASNKNMGSKMTLQMAAVERSRSVPFLLKPALVSVSSLVSYILTFTPFLVGW